MTDVNGATTTEDALEALQARADALERQLQDAELNATSRLRQFELKTEAMRAGIIDLDGLRLIDPKETSTHNNEYGSAADVISKLRRQKPWLFGSSNSSSVASTPEAVPSRRKLATEMTVEEWRAARSDLLRRR